MLHLIHSQTTPVRDGASGVDVSALFKGPALKVVALEYQPWPDNKGGFYLATFETGELLEAHDAAVAATIGVAWEQDRPVHVLTLGEEVIAAKLGPPRPAPLADLPADLATQLQLSLAIEEVARGLYDAAGIEVGQRAAWPDWKDVDADVREIHRAAALIALNVVRGGR